MSDAELIEKIPELLGYKGYYRLKWKDETYTISSWKHPTTQKQLSRNKLEECLASRDACWEVFEEDAEDGYWNVLQRQVMQEDSNFYTSNEFGIMMCKSTPRQRCEAFVSFMTTSPP